MHLLVCDLNTNMNLVNIGIVFFILSLQTNFIGNCDGFILETRLGKFIRNSTNIDDYSVDTSVSSRKLSKESIMSAFKGFLQIVDDPMLIKRSAMNYNILDVVRSEGFVENVSIGNLRNATLDGIDLANDDTYAALKFTLPLLKIAGWYNMTFHLDRHNISFYGNGTFLVQLNNFTTRLNVTLEKTAAGRTVLNKIVCNQTLSGVSIKVDNLLDDQKVSTILSENLSAVVPALHDAYKPSIDQFMARIILLYGDMLLFNAKHADLETLIQAFTRQQTS